MTETLMGRVWLWLHETFPERQIYIRSDGRVQFFTFGPALQATLAGLLLIFLTWVAFATVNVIFKDRIIAAKDHRYQQMQAAYESRVADLQLSYDEVNGALVSAEDKFRATADELQAKQNTIVSFLDRKRQVDATLLNHNAPIGSLPAEPEGGTPSDSVEVTPPSGGGDSDVQDNGAPDATVNPQPAKPQTRVAKPKRDSFLDIGGAVGRIAGALFGTPKPAEIPEGTFSRHPALRRLALQTERVRRIGLTETALITRAEGRVVDGVKEIQDVLRHTGIDPNRFQQRIDAVQGVGGPEVPLQSVHLMGISDSTFQQAYLHASAILEQMDELLDAMRHVPLTTPVSGPRFDRSSGFGARIDPFTGHYSFHPGIDFAGPWGSTVRATAPGTVVWAGPRGTYGNMVEVNHGFGIHTRYAHLSAVLVRIGDRVREGSAVGRLGSTGRSTGPHVHYEIWYDNVVRNPARFIEAGRNVLQQE